MWFERMMRVRGVTGVGEMGGSYGIFERVIVETVD
jgi:hypothetical protein